jgi:hypothetical protein
VQAKPEQALTLFPPVSTAQRGEERECDGRAQKPNWKLDELCGVLHAAQPADLGKPRLELQVDNLPDNADEPRTGHWQPETQQASTLL